MVTTRAKLSTTAKGLGHRHQRAVAALKRTHVDGTPCDWDGRPMYLDRTKNWDYDPQSTNPTSGELQGDHEMARAEAIRRGLPIPLPNRLLHAECNRQRGDGSNDHLAWINSGMRPVGDKVKQQTVDLVMPWPW